MGWQVVYTNALESLGTRQEQNRRIKKLDNAIKKIKPLKVDEMKKHGDELYEINLLKEDCLISAYNDKRLKSKALIKSAKKAIAKREKMATEDVSEVSAEAEINEEE